MREQHRPIPRSLTTSITLAALAAAVPAQQFQWTPGMLPGAASWTEGVESADVDGDGDLDLFFADGEGFSSPGVKRTNKLIINQLEVTAGQFADESAARLGTRASHARMPVAADVDGDGWVDCLFANAFRTDPPFLYVNRGEVQPGYFDEDGATRGLTASYSSGSAGFGDLDNDGDLDLIVCDSGSSYLGGTGGLPHLFINDGTGHFTENPAALGATRKKAHMDVQLVDFDNDWDLDFLGVNRATNTGGNHYLLLNDGAGNFTDASSLVPSTSGNVYEAEVGDLDGDTDMDLFFVSLGSFSEGAVRNDLVEFGSLGFTPGSTFGSGDDNEVALFDYDVDGDLDAIVGALGQSNEKMIRNSLELPGGGFAEVAGVFEATSDPTLDVEIADLNNDGRYEVITAQGEGSPSLWENKVYVNFGPAASLPPVIARVEPLAAPAQVGPWVVRAQVRDQVFDDGETYVSARADWTVRTSVGGTGVSGQVDALDMNGGIFRFEMTDTLGGGGAELCYTLTFTDWAGNQNSTSEVCVPLPGPPCGFVRYGEGLGGANVLDLAGVGTPQVGAVASLETTGMISGVAFLGMALGTSALTYQGGTVVLDPLTWLTTLVAPAAAGTASLPLPIPDDPSFAGGKLYFQAFELDTAQVEGVAMSNGLELTICP
jgi:hypothetical protein